MDRRRFIIGIGIVGAGTVGTSAYTSIIGERNATITFADDTNSLLGLEPNPEYAGGAEEYAQINEDNGRLELVIEDLPTNAITRFDDVLLVTNRGTQPVTFAVEADADVGIAEDGPLDFEVDGESVVVDLREDDLDEQGVAIDVGEGETVSIVVDDLNADASSDLESIETIRFIADTTGGSAVGPGGPEALSVGVVDSEDQYATAIAAALDGELDDSYQIEEASTATVVDSPGAYDAVVVQVLPEDDVAAFVTATEGADTGVVYLDQWGTTAEGIPQYAEESDDVDQTHEDDNYFGDAVAPISYEAVADHAILGGLAVGDETTIHTGEFADHTWFDLAADTGFEVIADVSDDTGAVGSGLAVDDGSGVVLASTLGRSDFVGDDEFTDAADEILGNAVDHVASSGT